jgi:hypothetical protein
MFWLADKMLATNFNDSELAIRLREFHVSVTLDDPDYAGQCHTAISSE